MMTNAATLTANDGEITVRVDVSVKSKVLTANELKRLLDAVASGTMRAMESAPYLYAPVSTIGVKN